MLGPDVTHLIERFVALELKEYRRIFRTNDEAGQLDNISRRFAWFRRLLQNHEIEHGRVFPSGWRVSWHLLAKLEGVLVDCMIIVLTYLMFFRDDLTTLLTKAGSSLSRHYWITFKRP